MSAGKTAGDYVHQFITLSNQLKRLPEENIPESALRTMFLTQVTDPAFANCVENLKMEKKALSDCYTTIRRRALQIDQERRVARQTRTSFVKPLRQQSYSDEGIQLPNTLPGKGIKRSAVPPGGHTFMHHDGIIQVPSEEWALLEESEKEFVREHNRQERRNRRKGKKQKQDHTPIQHQTPQSATSTAPNSILRRVTNEEEINQLPKKNPITFNLDGLEESPQEF
ncbi:MAG: hypothetical protein ACRDL7_00665 [Gaiellaceae bacterium]